MSKSNVTLRVDDDLLREVRIIAARKDSSISALLSTYIENIVRDEKAYEEAKEHALAILRDAKPLNWQKPKSRDELHER